MKKTIIPIVILYSFVSCVLDTMESMSIKNCTKDTVIVGASFSSSIDSVYMGEYGRFRFYDRLGAKWDSTWTVMNNKGMLDISKNELIPPDSMAAGIIFTTHWLSPEKCWNGRVIKLNTSEENEGRKIKKSRGQVFDSF